MAKSKPKKKPEPEPERPGFVRTTITIPADLKEQMEKFAGGENWSALAAECFRARVAAIKATQRTRGDMNKVIERLKAAAEVDSQSDYEDGKAAGRLWAEESATPAQLRRVCNYVADQNAWVGQPLAPWGWSDYFAMSVNPKIDRDDRGTAEELIGDFWDTAVGAEKNRLESEDSTEVSDFLRGFADGAAEVWGEVGGQV